MLQDIIWPLGNALINLNALITLTSTEYCVNASHNNRITETGWERISRSWGFFHFLCFKNTQVDFQAAL